MNTPKGTSTGTTGSSRGPGRGRRPKNTITTKSGNTLKVNRSINDRRKAAQAARSAEKAEYLSTLPKNRLKRILVRLHPKRVAAYWFSREGGVMALKLIGVSFVLGFILIIGLFAYFRKDLPKVKDIAGTSFGGSVSYYDKTGQTLLFQDYDNYKRTPVASKDISKYLKDATIAVEDKDFYKEGAFNVRGLVRAAAHDASGGSTQGGSTITQQLVKLNEGWTNDRTITRKVKELILAEELQREYTKDDILAGYLNLAPYGGVDYGAETAAQDYFGVSAKNLTLEQATMLAAIPKAPNAYSPYSSPKFNPGATSNYFDSAALLARQHYILARMVDQHLVTQAQATAAKKVDILASVHPLSSRYNNIKAPYFVLAAKESLQQQLGSAIIKRGGYKVITTLDLKLQAKAEQLVADNLHNVVAHKGDQEAMVGEDVQTGQIVMLVGGVDFTQPEYGQNNYAAGIKIPPGSSFKPYDYTTFIDNNNNVGAGSVLYDSKTTGLPGYDGTCPLTPAQISSCPPGTQESAFDYDLIFPGPITLRYALGGSRNVPAFKAMLSSVPNDTSKGHVKSINKVISTASAMMANSYNDAHHQSSYNCYSDEKQTVLTQCYAASAIGDGAYLNLDDHVNGLSTLARLGNAIPRTFILTVTDAAGHNVIQWKQPKANQVIKADTAYIVNSMASDPNASYLPGSCTATTCTPLSHGGYKFHRFNGWDFAVKTGTTNYAFDGLMTSWSTKYAVVSWIGNHTRNVAINQAAEFLTAPLTRGWMEYAHTDVTPVNWTQPATIKTAPAFVLRNHIHNGDIEPSPTNDLYPGHYVGGSTAKTSTSQTLDKVSGKVATSCTPAAAKDVQTNSNVAFWNVDIFNGGKSSITTGSTSPTSNTSMPTDDVHSCNDSPPTVTLTAPAECTVSCVITATITQGTHPLSDSQYSQFPGTVTISLGSNQIYTTTVNDSPSTVSFTYTPTSVGNDTLTATVSDSVLYTGTDTANLTYASAPKTQPLANLTAVVNGSMVVVNWSGGSGPYSLTRENGIPLCSNISANSCQYVKALAPLNTTVVLKDNSEPQQIISTKVSN
jgi:membrane peptidoglycan carboxypeptidase